MIASPSPHPDSQFSTPRGGIIQVKVHRARWSGRFPGNSLAAVLECYEAHVARAEVDFARLHDRDFLIIHDTDLGYSTTGSGEVGETTRADAQRLRLREGQTISEHHPPLLSELVACIASAPFPTLLELDMKDRQPWPWPRVEELAGMLQPVKDRITFGGEADWNLRRLLRVDSSFRPGFTPTAYLDWRPAGSESNVPPLQHGAYGYRDDHPLALARYQPTRDYLADRLDGILPLVPGLREVHLRLRTLEQMLDDGFADVVDHIHRAGVAVDAWTLDAGTPDWELRLRRAVDAGVDVLTTNTPIALARAGQALADASHG